MRLDEGHKNGDITIPKQGTWPKTVHELDETAWWALNAALASNRPLLLRGLPGTGKSQLARAAAAALKRVFLPIVVNARMDSQDLLYEYDAVQRLADAQTASLTSKSGDKTGIDQVELPPHNYIRPKALWWGLNWASALAISKGKLVPPTADHGHPQNGAVVLIDEIDKANLDLPNGLLETLGNGGFSVPLIDANVTVDKVYPLVVITTNEDRELPPAFVRRCLVHHLKLPENPDALKARLVRRGQLHFGELDSEVLKAAAEMLVADRERCSDPHFLPGQAEYLDVLRALTELGANKQRHLEILGKIGRFAFGKYGQTD